jgi:uncharacterized lipoprotein YmbA
MRTHLCAVLAACLLSACASGAGPVPRQVLAQHIAQPSAEPTPAPAPAATPSVAASSLNLADYMYGPPPRTRVDRRLRCRFDCPAYPPGTLFDPPR